MFKVHLLLILQHRFAQWNASCSPFMLHKKSNCFLMLKNGGWVEESHSLRKEAALKSGGTADYVYFCPPVWGQH